MNAAERINETTAAQRRAAEPGLSAFVSANAGAGKTRVLTNRVARLLLDGVDPSAILCITFTKAAAAEMADRLFTLLGGWALADDAKLSQDLKELDGDMARARDKNDLARARRLFARALETPGGLKIQTIHSFCEGVLKRFPLEAGVAPGFSVIDELETTRLVKAAVAGVAARAGNDAALAPSFAHLLSLRTGDKLRELLEQAIADRRKFARADAIGWAGMLEEAREALGVGAGDSVNAIRRDIAAMFPRDALARACSALEKGGGNPEKLAASLQRYLAAADDDARFNALYDFFATEAGTARQKIATNATDAVDQWAKPFLLNARDDFFARLASLRAAHAFEDTGALFTLLEAIFASFARAKSDRAALDFDDLISRTRALLTGDGKAGWVLYKLDQGLQHILLDEAQDTGPDAWDVIERPLAEFFAGAGARETRRTFFAVGDKKQSIYSFQGANAKLFDAKEIDLGKRIAAAAPYANVPLKASFRTTAPVLQFVDKLFEPPAVFGGVSDAAPEHHCTREGAAGSVEIWPLIRRDAAPAAHAWDAPLDQASATSPARQLAERVAAEIRGWLETGQILQSQGRPIAPGDIMILVQKRAALFHEMIRALGRASVAVAGADRIALVEDQAVLDLLSYARAALFEGDDLALAETLKGPFFNVSEESLFDLAHARNEARLWRALVARVAERMEWENAAREIALARIIARRDGPVAFFLHVLETGAPSGWRRLMERLGLPAREPVEEFLRQALDFEAANPRSLRLFLDAALKSQAMANRESSEAGASVRVMTAHKAKGLEANIVFILDSHSPPNTGKNETLFNIAGRSGADIPALAVGEGKLAIAVENARAQKKADAFEEYRRLLYVAATRAKDRLILCGHQHGNAKDPQAAAPDIKTWHALALDAFDALGEAATIDESGVRRLCTPQTVTPEPEREAGAASPEKDLPAFLSQPAAPERRARRLSPSMLGPAPDESAYPPGRRADAFLRGRILHRLLELLPEVAVASRAAAAARLTRRMGASLGEADGEAIVAEAMRVLDDPQFAPVFAPGSLAEAAIGGAPKGARAGLTLSGQIDRLAILKDRILIVDYKTNRPPPRRVEDVAEGYIAQLAAYRALLLEIYPGREVGAALLWTFDARLMEIPAEALDRAHRLTLA